MVEGYEVVVINHTLAVTSLIHNRQCGLAICMTCMQNHRCTKVENAFPVFKMSRLVRVHTDSHHNGHNKMIFAVSDV